MQHGNASDETSARADTGTGAPVDLGDMSADTGADADALADYERRENVASIRHAPRHILPHGPARAHLVRLADAGQDVYVYRGAGLNGSGVWNVWLINRRVPLADYVARYEGRQIGAQLAADGADSQDAAARELMERARELRQRAAAGGSISQDDYEWTTGTGAYAADAPADALAADTGAAPMGADASAPSASDTSDTGDTTETERGR